MGEYKVRFEVFEGPLDLLLYLIKREEVDIYQVNLTRLAEQFIAYIEAMRLLDLEVAGEFLVMAATLMYIKYDKPWLLALVLLTMVGLPVAMVLLFARRGWIAEHHRTSLRAWLRWWRRPRHR